MFLQTLGCAAACISLQCPKFQLPSVRGAVPVIIPVSLLVLINLLAFFFLFAEKILSHQDSLDYARLFL